MNLDSFKNVISKIFTNPIYSIYVYKEDLAVNNLQGFICHKTKPNNDMVLWHIDPCRLSNAKYCYYYYSILLL